MTQIAFIYQVLFKLKLTTNLLYISIYFIFLFLKQMIIAYFPPKHKTYIINNIYSLLCF